MEIIALAVVAAMDNARKQGINFADPKASVILTFDPFE